MAHDPTADLLRAVADQIESHPETWNQSDWSGENECGTTHCIGGWAAALAGAAHGMGSEADLLGFSGPLATALFYFDVDDKLGPEWEDDQPPLMVPLLRALADLPAPRTLEQAQHLLAGVNA